MTRSTLVRFLLFVLGPLLLAVGLSLVTNTMIISGEIIAPAMGEFREGTECAEFHTWPALPEASEDYGEYLGEDVASTDIIVEAGDNDQLAVMVSGAYPSYGVECSIPYEVFAAEGNTVQLEGGVVFVPGSGLTGCGLNTDSPPAYRWECTELTVLYAAPIAGACIEAGEFTDELIFHVEQPAPQQSTLNFQLRLEWFECDPGGDNQEEDPDDPGGSFTTFGSADPVDPADPPRVSEVAAAPRAVARVSPAITGDGGLLGADRDVSRVGFGSLLVVLGACLVAASLPLGLTRRWRLKPLLSRYTSRRERGE